MIAEEEERLRAAFGHALLLCALAATQVACSTAKTPDAVDVGDSGADSGPLAAADASDGAVIDKCSPTAFTPNPPDTCGDYIRFPCGLPNDVSLRGDCFFNLGDCNAICPDIHFNCHLADGYCNDAGAPVADDAGALVVDCTTCPGSVGRIPSGLERFIPSRFTAPHARGSLAVVGAYFARAAHLEAASVFAFRYLREELEELGAPFELVLAARSAERDEVRHTRAVARLARRFGSDHYVRPIVRPRTTRRSLEEIATENAVEGCVRETFGALVAAWQASHARDADVARTLGVIANDERRHAALSWAVARWSLAKLDVEARTRIDDACRATIRDLRQQEEVSIELVTHAGLPNVSDTALLIDELTRTIWPSFLEEAA